jgi:glucosamine--fructose-6-phosphate aminotransferase (isomerizing)
MNRNRCSQFIQHIWKIMARIRRVSGLDHIYVGRSPDSVPHASLIFFPLQPNRLCCGLAGIVTVKKRRADKPARPDLSQMNVLTQSIEFEGLTACRQDPRFADRYLGGEDRMNQLLQSIKTLKKDPYFFTVYVDAAVQGRIREFAERLEVIIQKENHLFSEQMGRLPADRVELVARRLDLLRDIVWCLQTEILDNIEKTRGLLSMFPAPPSFQTLQLFKKINTVLNSIDRLEVRGRDSAGISLLFVLSASEFEQFRNDVARANLLQEFEDRNSQEALLNRGISVHRQADGGADHQAAVSFTYKVAVEVGNLGDNIQYLRKQLTEDRIFHQLALHSPIYDTVCAHTRWASVGAITEANCHPVDNKTAAQAEFKTGIIHTCLNGDIDNFLELRSDFERLGRKIPDAITTDTKIIPLQIEKYLLQGFDVTEAFRRAVNDFEGSHAITMHTDLAPGTIFLAQRGSGQTIFVGLAEDHYMPTSEVYGFVEETSRYIKLEGEKEVPGPNGPTRGQIVVLSQDAAGGLDGIQAMSYDGTPIAFDEHCVKKTEITSRDIDRQDFPHYFLKEITESPNSVEKTLLNRWRIKDDGSNLTEIHLDDRIMPPKVRQALVDDRIKRIFFIGQGTAGVAALACANILNTYLDNPALLISALKASEFSGFTLKEGDQRDRLSDTLVIAISQSGTTTDTNRTIDMVKERGAYTLAIVNRRDSDITFKVDGVMYTSSGRDIEMSVASTKAFYSQIIAGAILGLFIARLKNRRSDGFVSEEIRRLRQIPEHMRTVLALGDQIRQCAERLAVTKIYWAAVGSGPNKASADEIRIKLSELCYKTISTDYVEDKKHIDLSSEPLIIVCGAGNRATVIGDIIKDTAIFKAHKATPVVIADEGEERFTPYAEAVFYVPKVEEHLAPILNTLVGHIWGYYAALAINNGSRFMYRFQQDLQDSIDDYVFKGLDVYEIILEKPFREKIAQFYYEFRKQKAEKRLPATIGFEAASDLTLLLKYLSGRLPVSDFEIDFGQKGTAKNMLNCLYRCLGETVNFLARPVDAIKHQAKTVTVGTSRISDRITGILFDALAAQNVNVSQLTNSNVIVLKNLQRVVSGVQGTVFYRITGLNLLGEPVEDTRIQVVDKRGIAATLSSRVEGDSALKGTKRIIIAQGNVYIGKGRKDNRSIIVIPILSPSVEKPNVIEYLLLLHLSFEDPVSLAYKIKALGGKYEHIKNIVLENSIAWDDQLIESVAIDELFGRSAEKVAEFIVSQRRLSAK